MYSAPDMLDLLHYLAFMCSAIVGACWMAYRFGKMVLDAVFTLCDLLSNAE